MSSPLFLRQGKEFLMNVWSKGSKSITALSLNPLGLIGIKGIALAEDLFCHGFEFI